MKQSYGSAVPDVILPFRSQEYKKPKCFYLTVFQGLRSPTSTWGHGHLEDSWSGETKCREEMGSILI